MTPHAAAIDLATGNTSSIGCNFTALIADRFDQNLLNDDSKRGAAMMNFNGQRIGTGMTLAAGATINVDADEVAHMLADETGNRLTISDQLIVVTNAISRYMTWCNNNR